VEGILEETCVVQYHEGERGTPPSKNKPLEKESVLAVSRKGWGGDVCGEGRGVGGRGMCDGGKTGALIHSEETRKGRVPRTKKEKKIAGERFFLRKGGRQVTYRK